MENIDIRINMNKLLKEIYNTICRKINGFRPMVVYYLREFRISQKETNIFSAVKDFYLGRCWFVRKLFHVSVKIDMKNNEEMPEVHVYVKTHIPAEEFHNELLGIIRKHSTRSVMNYNLKNINNILKFLIYPEVEKHKLEKTVGLKVYWHAEKNIDHENIREEKMQMLEQLQEKARMLLNETRQ